MNEQIKQRINQLNNGEIPNGYKKTEFGIFPCDWVADKRVKDIGTFGKGKGLPGDKMTLEGVPCVGYGDIYMKYNNFHFEKAKSFVDEETASESQPIQKGTLLFTGTGETAEEIGKCVCYNGDETIYAGGDILTFISNEVNPLFLTYQQYQDFSLRNKASFGQGHSVVHIQRENLEKLHVAYPKSTEEQSKIAEILMKWDEAIELQEQYIQTLLSMKITYVDKFFCAPGEEKTKFDLLYKTAGEGGTPDTKKQAYYDSEDVPFVKIEHLAEKYITKIDSYISNLGLQKSGAWLIPENCLIFSNGATIGEASINKIPVATKQGILGIVPSDVIDVEYFYYLVKSKYFLSKVKKITTKGTMCTAYLKDINRLSLFIHEKENQIKIAEILSSIDCLIEDEKRKVDLLKKQRKTLQQYLLNGIVRVK